MMVLYAAVLSTYRTFITRLSTYIVISLTQGTTVLCFALHFVCLFSRDFFVFSTNDLYVYWCNALSLIYYSMGIILVPLNPSSQPLAFVSW